MTLLVTLCGNRITKKEEKRGMFCENKIFRRVFDSKRGSNRSVEIITFEVLQFIFLIQCQKGNCTNEGDILWHIA
jgi:hypothetical protein